MVNLLLVRQEVSVSGSEPSKQTFRVKNGPLGPSSLGSAAISDTLDFVAQTYETSAGADTLAGTLGAGLTLSPPLGLYITYSPNTNRPTPQGQFLADLVAALALGMKVTFEFNTANGTNGFMFYMGDAANFNDASNYIILTENGLLYDLGTLHIDNPVPDVGTHKVEIVLNKALGGGLWQYSVTYNGGSPIVQTVNYEAAVLPFAEIGWSGLEGDGQNLFQTYVTKISVEALSGGGPPVPGVFIPEFTVLKGNFLQVIDLIGPAPLPAPDALTAGPDDRREAAIAKLREWD